MVGYLAARRDIVIACDHIGIGDSSPIEPFALLTPEPLLAADTGLHSGLIISGIDLDRPGKASKSKADYIHLERRTNSISGMTWCIFPSTWP
jgi:hypothetical protein